MKKNLLSIILLFICAIGFAQKGFESKIKTPSGQNIIGDFETISSKNKQSPTSPKFAFSPKQIAKRILKDEDSGAVVFIDNPVYTKDQRNAKKSSVDVSRSFLNSVKKDLKINNPEDEFSLISDETDELGLRHLKLTQSYKGVPIYGGESVVHTNRSGVAEFMMGKIFASPTLNTIPNINATSAIELSLKDLGKSTIV